MSADGIVTDQMTVEEYLAPMPGQIRTIKSLGPRPNEIYVNGARFRVIQEGARFEGIRVWGPTSWGGYVRKLELGGVITCLGWVGDFRNRSSVQVPNWTMRGVPPEVRWCQFWPFTGLWSPWPLDGFLEKLDEYEEE